MNDLVKLLKELTKLNGIPSNEREVSKYIESQVKESVERDNLGSLIIKKGSGPKVMIAAHMDEVGLMITKITPEGFLKFQTVGAFSTHNLLNQQWTITTKTKKYRAVTGYKPLFLLTPEAKGKSLEMKDFYLDAGFSSEKEVLDAGIHVGDMVTPYTELELIGNHRVLAKALDDRAGVAVLLKVLENTKKLNNEFYAAFTVQEEFGVKGAKTASYIVEPDIVISVDVGAGMDVPGGEKAGNELGKGPQIYIYDTGLVAHQGLRNFVIDVARKNKIPFQESYLTFGRTDASQMQLSKTGAAGLSVGIPTRNIHSHTSIADLRDIENTILLITKVLEALNQETVDKILYD